jgi:chromate reductase, NAD(P)H dehydrogenase (quinone)
VTTDKPRILAIVGSLRRESHSLAICRTLQHAVGDKVQFQPFTLENVPLYNADDDGDNKPQGVVAFKKAIEDAQGLIVISPEYNYGIPGVLKNALDWASRPGYKSPLKDKHVLIIASSIGLVGGARAYTQVRNTLLATLSRVVPAPEVLVPQIQNKIQDGKVTDATSLKFLTEGFEALLAEIRR